MSVRLPPFPVDDATLDLLWAAMYPRENGDPNATTSGVWPLLTFMSQMAGSDTSAVEEVLDDGSDGGASIAMMRDPQYHDHDVLTSLITEVRRLRAEAVEAEARGYATAIARLRDEEAAERWWPLNSDDVFQPDIFSSIAADYLEDEANDSALPAASPVERGPAHDPPPGLS